MSTLRYNVSRVRSTDKLLSGDNTINDRVVVAELRSAAATLIRQYANKRQLWTSDTLFTTVPCLELEEVPIAECCGYESNITVARSKYPLPSISEGYYNYLIKGVFSIELNKTVTYTDVNTYINIKKLGLRNNNVYYWIHNSYIYISSPDVKIVTLIAFFEGDLDSRITNPECECKNKFSNDNCLNPLDEEFKCPGFLIDAAIDMVRQKLLQTYFKIPVDHNSDNKDDQVNKV